MQADIDRVLIPQARIAARIREMAAQITRDHTTRSESGAAAGEIEVTIVPILTGAMIFTADLIRHLPMRMRIGLLTVSSYPGRSLRSQGAGMIASQLGDLRGRHILLVDDILDSGNTIRAVRALLATLSPASVKVCAAAQGRSSRGGRRDARVCGL